MTSHEQRREKLIRKKTTFKIERKTLKTAKVQIFVFKKLS